ncbi:MAG: LysR family transcriptional regulator [Betaproteobacteria bacterium]|nr:LysR family transcriptional regulator [Betaproteobacteria bacterium]
MQFITGITPSMAQTHRISAQIRWTLDGLDIEPRLVTLLESVARNGNLQAAAKSAGLSYRHAWGLLEAAGNILGDQLVIRQQGRGTLLSPLGTKLLQGMVDVNGSFAAALREGEARMAGHLAEAPATQARSGRVAVHASHDLALAQMREAFTRSTGIALELQFHGSLDCLSALRRKRCEIAGFHLPAIPGARTLAAQFLPYLGLKGWLATHLLDRTQGLMVRAGNPKHLHRLADLTKPGVRFVNRQPGSGTRLCLDFLLAQQGVAPAGIHGYSHEEFTHAAVAATVASGMADVAFGIEAAAREQALDFVPVVNEHYYLAARASALARPGVHALLAWLDSRNFRRLVNGLAGYRSTAALDWRPAAQILR